MKLAEENQMMLPGVEPLSPAVSIVEPKRNPLLDWDTDSSQRKYTLVIDGGAVDGLSTKLTFRLPKWLKKAFIKLAAEDGVSTSKILREMIEARVRAKMLQNASIMGPSGER